MDVLLRHNLFVQGPGMKVKHHENSELLVKGGVDSGQIVQNEFIGNFKEFFRELQFVQIFTLVAY